MINPFTTTFMLNGQMYSKHEIVEVRLGGDWVQRRLAMISDAGDIYCYPINNESYCPRWKEIRKRDEFR